VYSGLKGRFYQPRPQAWDKLTIFGSALKRPFTTLQRECE